ncbi:Nif3-like dinuclear metal center hexameric protein, partial [Bordetella pertussis]|uniref:Nif3-like dinuclear metal center hexameric protein n=1 Tax=Bordetella pertussis TaxID=520 RepID=UPI000A472802
MKTIHIRELADWLDGALQAARFKDYCPNGLQVEGKAEIAHIITGVTASEALLRAAIERGADAVLVHHGWFWRNEDRRVLGPRRTRLALALGPDGAPRTCGADNLVWLGSAPGVQTVAQLQ